MYEDYKIYGPYLWKDGRLRCVLKNLVGGKNKFISYPKLLFELHTNRYLEKDEQIDHIDGNPLNNDISNLQVIKFKEHQKNDVERNKNILVTCKYCGKNFLIEGTKIRYRNRSDKNQSGYFCSRSCSGKYGKEIQLKTREKTKEERIISEKYKLKSCGQKCP